MYTVNMSFLLVPYNLQAAGDYYMNSGRIVSGFGDWNWLSRRCNLTGNLLMSIYALKEEIEIIVTEFNNMKARLS